MLVEKVEDSGTDQDSHEDLPRDGWQVEPLRDQARDDARAEDQGDEQKRVDIGQHVRDYRGPRRLRERIGTPAWSRLLPTCRVLDLRIGVQVGLSASSR